VPDEPPPFLTFPSTEAQAKVVGILLAAVFVTVVCYGLLRGFGLTQFFTE
jgi:hypothetical protein